MAAHWLELPPLLTGAEAEGSRRRYSRKDRWRVARREDDPSWARILAEPQTLPTVVGSRQSQRRVSDYSERTSYTTLGSYFADTFCRSARPVARDCAVPTVLIMRVLGFRI